MKQPAFDLQVIKVQSHFVPMGWLSNRAPMALFQRRGGSHICEQVALKKRVSHLADNIIEQIKKVSPSLFEKLVVELLLKMGYGGSRKDAGEAIGRSGDEGIDGIIKEDRLGLDIIYIQAKRWAGAVGRPEVQKFAGALQGQRAKKA